MSWKGPIVEVISTAICAAALGRRRHCATREAHRRAGGRATTVWTCDTTTVDDDTVPVNVEDLEGTSTGFRLLAASYLPPAPPSRQKRSRFFKLFTDCVPMATFWETTYDDGLPTHSTNEQLKTEDACRAVFEEWINPDGSLSRESCASRQRVNDSEPCACRPIPLLTTCLTCARDRSVSFCRTEHAAYLKAGLGSLAAGYVSLDASRPWLTYWISHSLELLGPSHALRGDEADNVVGFLRRCQVPGTGGFAGGAHPGQIAHLAPTYAAINTMVTIGTPAALAAIDRASLRVFLRRMKRPDGSFSMHDDGECDVRGVYTALAVASLTNLLDDELRRGAAEWIASCQTYEGGIGATPGEEAHGGYTFCGLASMVLLDRVELLRVPPLTRWLVERQMGVHGGFQGRTNKLVDGCYSFWQGGAFPLLEAALTRTAELPSGGIASLFSTDGLLDYLFVCCQQSSGGLRDKPGRGYELALSNPHTSWPWNSAAL